MKNNFKNLIKAFFVFLFLNTSFLCAQEQNYDEIIQNAMALYATGNYSQSYNLLDNLPVDKKNENVFLILYNIAQEQNDDNAAISNLNKALDINYEFYKAYYNLGCIFASKESYLLALNNFELASKYNKEFAPAYYNLAYCQMKLKNFKGAKKNLIKALELEPDNKDILYNLIYCYKELNEEKRAKKLIDVYNKLT